VNVAETQIGTKETQELIYKRRVERLLVTKGVSRGKLIDRVNASSQKKQRLRKHEPPLKEKPPESH